MARILVLSRSRNLYSTKRMTRTAKELGHELRIVDPLLLELWVDRDQPKIFYGKRALGKYDVVLPRIGASITTYGLAVVNQFEMLGTAVVNRSQAIARSRDKLRSSQLMMRHNVDMPRTVFARSPKNLDRMLKAVGGTPCIVKLTEGTQGVGVMIAESRESLEAMLETFFSMGQNIIIQEFIKESRGRDVRAFVVGNRVVGAMRREARVGEFRSNIHRGGSGRPVELSEEYEKVALLATRIMGLQVAGVDMLESKSGPKVMEVNSSPGFEGLEKATNLDIARVVVEYAAEYAATWRETDAAVPLVALDH
jgi:ribosomal protein S6--L-glutamate ligase